MASAMPGANRQVTLLRCDKCSDTYMSAGAEPPEELLRVWAFCELFAPVHKVFGSSIRCEGARPARTLRLGISLDRAGPALLLGTTALH